jgi:transcriptional regulator with XRE-family HTH domain
MIPPRSSERTALAEFVKSRRLRASSSPRASTPGRRRPSGGLRREEVAQLAGVGITWYTWFEQGRQIRVSEAFLDNLSRALSLDASERQHLFLLAQHRVPPGAAPLTTSTSAALQRIVSTLPNPAYVKNLRWDVLAWNRASSIMFGDYARIPESHRNALWLVFRSLEYRQFMVNWADDARDLMARFRSDLGQLGGDARAAALIDDLRTTSREFREWWNDHGVTGRSSGIKCFRHPAVGSIEFEHTRLRLDGDSPEPLRVVIFTPLPGVSASRAAKLFRADGRQPDTPATSTPASIARC